jgi:type IV pilus assembly protein PilY1
LWEFDSSDLSELGETWSQPRLAKIPVDSDNFKVVIFVGAGYDNNEDLRYGNTQTFADLSGVDINQAGAGGTVDGTGSPEDSAGTVAADDRHAPRGRGILAIEVAHLSRNISNLPYEASISSSDEHGSTVGDAYWSYTYNDNNLLKYSIPSDLTVLDLNGDSFADTIYTGDTGGNLWRFNVGGANTNTWSGTLLFNSNESPDGTVGRKIFYQPSIGYVGAPHIYFGTGDREHPLNMAVTDRMYCVIDWGAQGTYPVNESSLVDATLNTIQALNTSEADAAALEEIMKSSPVAPYDDNGIDKFTYGWYVKLDGTDRTGNANILDPGEKVVAPPTVFNGEVYFSTYQLQTGDRAGCKAGNLGIARRYHMDFRTAEAVRNYDESNDLDSGADYYNDDGSYKVNERSIAGEDGEIFQRTDRVETLGEGMSSGTGHVTGESGEIILLDSASDQVRTTSGGTIKLTNPVYWMQW